MERENYSWDLSLPSSQNGFDICSNRKIWDYILRCPYKGLFSSKQHRSAPRNNSLHPGYLTSLVTGTNHNTIQTIGIYVRVFRTAEHAGQIFIPHRRPNGRRPNVVAPKRRRPNGGVQKSRTMKM